MSLKQPMSALFDAANVCQQQLRQCISCIRGMPLPLHGGVTKLTVHNQDKKHISWGIG
jgi:hypothetical protein